MAAGLSSKHPILVLQTHQTDLCDAIAVEYGAAGVLVVAVNDQQPRYSYPARVRFELTEGDLSSYQAAAEFLNSSNVDLVKVAIPHCRGRWFPTTRYPHWKR
jgi:hypothetical protein